MPDYLSEEWIAELDGALRAATIQSAAPLEMETVVHAPTGTIRYRVMLDDRGARARRSREGDASADLRLTTDYATAVAIARGRENAQTALAAGRLQLGGDVNLLLRAGDTFAALDDLTGALRAGTTFPASPPVGSGPDVG